MTKFAGMVSPTNVSFTGIDGKNHIISTAHPNDERIRELMRETRAAFMSGDDTKGNALWQELTDLTDIPASIAKASEGRITIRNHEVYFMDEVLHNAITQRIMWCIEEKEDPTPYMKFLDNLMENPSKRAVDELFGFLEACNMGITDDGMILAYKRVRDNYLDIHSGTMRNAVGDVVTMPRNRVDEDKNRTCSTGLHFCSFSYLPSFGSSHGNRVMIVEVHPKDVVAVPSDYKNAKARACSYKVIGEYKGADIADVLSAKPVWRPDDVRESFGNQRYRDRENATIESLIEAIREADDLGVLKFTLAEDTLVEALPVSIFEQLGDIISDHFNIDFYEDIEGTLGELVVKIKKTIAEDEEENDDDDFFSDDGNEETEDQTDDQIDGEAYQTSASEDANAVAHFASGVIALTAEHLGLNSHEVFLGSSLVDDLGADSLDLVELVMAYEERYEIEISDSEAEELGMTATVNDVVQALWKQVSPDSHVAAPSTGVTTVFVYPESSSDGNTRWIAECPDCNGGVGWKQDYARKRDARRGIKRTLGENVSVVERNR